MKLSLLIALTFILALFAVQSAQASSLKVVFPQSASQGGTVVILGKIKPAKKNVKLTLEQQAGVSFTPLAISKSDRRGAFSFQVIMPTASSITLRVKAKVGKKKLTSKTKTIPLTASNNGSGDNGSGDNGSGSLFTPPGQDLSGQAAADRIVPYLTNSTFTDCIAGWPACAVEQRYGHFANGEMYYCRLTGSGSQIINAPFPYQIIGAEMKADGSWAVNIAANAYGNTIYYAWQVDTRGVAYGAYWNSSNSIYENPNSPTERMGPLQWVRGARSCDS